MEQLYRKIAQEIEKQCNSVKRHVDKRIKKLDRKIETFRQRLYNIERRKLENTPKKSELQYTLKTFDTWKANDLPNEDLRNVFDNYGPTEKYGLATQRLSVESKRIPEGLRAFVINHFNTPGTANIHVVGTRCYIYLEEGWLVQDAAFMQDLCDDLWEKYTDVFHKHFKDVDGWDKIYSKIDAANQGSDKALTKSRIRQYLFSVSKLAKINRKLFE